MKSWFKNERGFTLIEVVVAIVIITALVGAFAPLIASSVRNVKWAGERTKQLYEIRSMMERKLAVSAGDSDTVLIKGRNVAGKASSWPVSGTLVKVPSDDEDEDEDAKIDELLVSFVIPKE